MTDLVCPTCGKPFEGKFIPLEWLPIAVSGTTGQLILKVLSRNVGLFTTAAQIAELVYGNQELETPDESVRANIWYMKPRIERAGWIIEGKNRAGYRLMPKGDAQ